MLEAFGPRVKKKNPWKITGFVHFPLYIPLQPWVFLGPHFFWTHSAIFTRRVSWECEPQMSASRARSKALFPPWTVSFAQPLTNAPPPKLKWLALPPGFQKWGTKKIFGPFLLTWACFLIARPRHVRSSRACQHLPARASARSRSPRSSPGQKNKRKA